MARLFISYNRKEAPYAFAVRQWLMDAQGWISEDIFFDARHLHTGVDWEKKLLVEAEGAEVMLFLASENSLNIDSFCYRELKHATGQIIAVTVGGIAFDDERLDRALPHFAKARQVTALDQEPVEDFPFVSPVDNSPGTVRLNRDHVEGIGLSLRELGVAPNSFTWTPTPAGPFPGLRPLMEGDEAIFCGRDLEIRDGLKAIEELRATITRRALIIQAPSGAGKSSFLRAGLWRRLRRNPGFTPLAIVRAQNGILHHPEWGLIAGLIDTLARDSDLGRKLPLSGDEIASRATSDLPGLLAAFAEADKADSGRRTLLLGIDQAEEMVALSPGNDAELEELLQVLVQLPRDLDVRLILTARDDSVDATLERLAKSGLPQTCVETWRLHRLPASRFDEIINGPAAAANRAGWKLPIDPGLVDALVAAAGAGGEGGDALPILALALQRMVAKRRTPDGRITLEPREAQAFLESAVSESAGEALKAAKTGPEDLRRLIIPRLATWDPRAGAEGAAKRQVAGAADLFTGERAGLKPLADALVAQRLLTLSRTESGPAYEVAHEALLRVPPLGDLIFARREKFEQARIVEVETREWADAGRSAANLVRFGERLKDAMALLEDPDFGPDLRGRKHGTVGGQEATVAQYLEACRDHEVREERKKRSNQRRVMAGLSTLTAVAVAFSVLAVAGMRRALDARNLAWEQSGIAAEKVAAEHPGRYPDRIFQRARAIGFAGYGGADYQQQGGNLWSFVLEAYRLLRGETDRFPVLLPERVGSIQEELEETPAYLPFWRSDAHGSPVTAVRLNENETALLARFEDKTGRSWTWPAVESSPEPAPESLEPTPQSTAVVLEGNTVRFHAFGKDLELTGHPTEVKVWALSKDQEQLFVGLADGTVMAWDLTGADLGVEADLMALFDEDSGWFRFDEQQELVPGPRTIAGRSGFGSELTAPKFKPETAEPFRNSLGMPMLPVAPGEFLMGSPERGEERDDEETQHRVRLTYPFWLGQFEVTQAEWTAMMGENPSDRKDPLAPVTDVSWLEATEFCEKLTVRERVAGLLPKDWTYALPTEAQWEYACRAGTTTPFSFGNVLDGSQANCNGKSPYGTTVNGPNLAQTVAVGRYPANAWGFYDMHGNVYEWCRDWYDDYEFKEGEVSPDPNGRASGDYRVFRGGGWGSRARLCRSASRIGYAPDDAFNSLGFRLAAVPISSIPPEASSPGTASGR